MYHSTTQKLLYLFNDKFTFQGYDNTTKKIVTQDFQFNTITLKSYTYKKFTAMASIQYGTKTSELKVAAIYDSSKIGYFNLVDGKIAYEGVKSASNCGKSARLYSETSGFFCGPKFNSLGVSKVTFFPYPSLEGVEIPSHSGKLIVRAHIIDLGNDVLRLFLTMASETRNLREFSELLNVFYDFSGYKLGERKIAKVGSISQGITYISSASLAIHNKFVLAVIRSSDVNKFWFQVIQVSENNSELEYQNASVSKNVPNEMYDKIYNLQLVDH